MGLLLAAKAALYAAAAPTLLPPVHLEPLVGGGRRLLKAPSSLWGPRVDTYRPKRPRTDEDRRRLAAAEAKRERKNQRRKAEVGR